jgi:PhnB protein
MQLTETAMKKTKAKTKAKATKRKVSPIPKGYHSVTPYLSVRGGGAAIEFYKKAFGAKEIMRMPGPKGDIGHAEIEIGGSRIMLADEHPEIDFLSPAARGGTTVTIHLYVPNADKMMQRATEAGGTVVQPLKDQFYGDRTGSLRDPFGHVWHLATHKEDLSMAELKKRAEQAAKGAG